MNELDSTFEETDCGDASEFDSPRWKRCRILLQTPRRAVLAQRRDP
jgi:hypothetical protein